MAHLPEQFATASSNLEPEEDARNAKTAHEEVRDVLSDDEYLTDQGLETLLIGSYARSVSIKRVKDVDVFGMLHDADSELNSAAILEHLKKTLEAEYESVTLQARSIKVDFDDYDLSVDVVPARPYGDHWEIPDPAEGWLETDPLKLGDLTTGMNKRFTLGGVGVYLPVVKLVRQVRRALGLERPSGLYFEVLTYWAFSSGEVSGTTRASYLTTALDEIVDQFDSALQSEGLEDPTLEARYIGTKATATELQVALDRVRQSATQARAALDEQDSCESAMSWRELLGKDSEDNVVFPMPDECSDDGGLKAAVYVPGEKRGPQGADRFA